MTAIPTTLENWQQGRATGMFFPLGAVVRFALSGNDRVRYLNGQCSNDVRKLSPGSDAIQACILSARGKLDAVVWIWAEPDRLVVECDAVVADALAIRLEKYLVADDVTIEQLPDTGSEWHVIAGADQQLDRIAETPLRRIARMGSPGVDVPRVPPGLIEANDVMLTQLRIENLVPAWGNELHPDTLPAEAGLDKTAVDFHKGCYLGQEVVSRIESVGRANRILRAFEVSAGPTPVAGDVFPHPAQPGKPGAEITSVAPHFGLSKTVGLCYIRRGVTSGETLISAGSSTRITILHPSV